PLTIGYDAALYLPNPSATLILHSDAEVNDIGGFYADPFGYGTFNANPNNYANLVGASTHVFRVNGAGASFVALSINGLKSNGVRFEITGLEKLSVPLALNGFEFTNTGEGLAALTFGVSASTKVVLNAPSFGVGVSTNINASALLAASTITVKDALGLKAGSGYEVDPKGVVQWLPEPTPAPPNFSYSGNFSAGAVIASDNGQNELGHHVLVDTVTSGGHYLYVLFHSTSGSNPGDTPDMTAVVKYNASGAMLSSATLSGNVSGDGFVRDDSGNIYVSEKSSSPAGKQIWISKYDANLAFMTSVSVPTSEVGAIIRMATDGTFIYTANDGGNPSGSAKLIKYNSSLVAVATAAYSIGSGHVNADGIALDRTAANILIRVSTGSSAGAERHLLKYAANFNGAAPLFDANITSLAALEGDVAFSSNSAFTISPDVQGASVKILKFDESLNYTGVSATINNASAFLGKTDTGPGGNLYIAVFSSSSAGVDYLALKYNRDLVLQASATFNGSANGQDLGIGLAVADSTTVYVTGASFNGSNFDALTVKLNLSGVSDGAGTFTGDFSQASGAVFDNAGNAAGGMAVAVDASTNVYVVGRSSNGPNNFDWLVIKYNSAGVLLASATYNSGVNSDDRPQDVLADGAYVWVGGGNPAGGYLIKYNAANLSVAGTYSAALTGRSVVGLTADGAGGVYATSIHNGNATLYVTRFDSVLNNIGEAVVSVSADWNMQFRNVGRDGGGRVFVAYVDKATNLLHVANYDTSLGTPADITIGSRLYGGVTMAMQGNMRYAMAKASATTSVQYIFQLDAGGNLLTATSSTSFAGASPGFWAGPGTLSIDRDLDLYASDGPIVHYRSDLTFVSSSAAPTPVGSLAAADASRVFVTGGGNGAQFVTMKLDLSGASNTKIWAGSAFGNASQGANWIGGAAPQSGDYVVFGDTAATAACNWDLAVTLGSLTFKDGYRASVDFSSSVAVDGPFEMTSDPQTVLYFVDNPANSHSLNGPVTISSGTFHIGGTTVVAVGSITVNGGTLEMHDRALFKGSEIAVMEGPGRLRLFDSGGGGPTLTSTGTSTGAVLKLVVDGVVDISSGVFQRLGGKGLQIGNKANLITLSSVTFQGPLPAGATAINFDTANTNFVSTFTNINFADTNVAVNVNGANLTSGARITMRAASGSRAGPNYENDSAGRVDWYDTLATPVTYYSVANLAVTARSSSTLHVEWDANGNPSGTRYYVHYATGDCSGADFGGGSAQGSTPQTTSTSTIMTGLLPSAPYQFHIHVISLEGADLTLTGQQYISATTLASGQGLDSTPPLYSSCGGGGGGFDDGPQSLAIAIDSGGSIWEVISDSSVIRLGKFNSEGVFVSSVALPNAVSDGSIMWSIEFDASNNAYAIGIASYTPSATLDVIVYKVAGSGSAVLSTATFNDPSYSLNDIPLDSAIDSSGIIWITGFIQTGGDFNSDSGSGNVTGAMGFWKYNTATGELTNLDRHFGPSNVDGGFGIAINAAT
ncbi:MAG: fibronectin type III domain-containing protein, partial [Elusimicrobia bacterium]|nr:fibronectin type III domain-containing protein [Elusimicrobiota bacterium]